MRFPVHKLVTLCKTSVFIGSMAVFAAAHGTNVLMQHNDQNRSGGVLLEGHLNTSNVNVNEFGRLGAYPVDDQMYAQPLYMSDVPVGELTYDMVLVATTNNSVYAFDADDYNHTKPLWSRNYNDPAHGIVPPVAKDVGQGCGVYKDFSGNIGIVGTPVIDDESFTIYFVTRTKQNGVFSQWFHAVDIRNGSEKAGSPTKIEFTVDGSGTGSVNGKIAFDPKIQNQRLSLTLVNGVVYMGWSSHCTTGNYHGYLAGYDAKTLQLVRTFITTPDGSEGGIWQAGNGPGYDDEGNLYILTANGTHTGAKGGRDWGQSFLKLQPDGAGFKILSYFTPHDHDYLTTFDLDLGSSGMLLIPGTDLAIGGGKIGQFYLVNRNDMGGWNQKDDSQIPQTFTVSANKHIHGAPVYWEGSKGKYIYVWPENSHMTQYQFDGQRFNPTPVGTSAMAVPQGMPGAMLSVSSMGSKAGTGIVWASHPASGDANHGLRPGILRAFDAADITKEIWNSRMNMARDDFGVFAKFSPPTIVNGRVYLPTFANQLVVYGLFSEANVTNPHGNPVDPSEPIGPQEATGPVRAGNLYSFSSKLSSKCLDIPANLDTNGLHLQQYDCNATEAQIFRAQDAGGGLFNLISLGFQKCLEIANAGLDNGVNLQQNDCSMGSAKQKFTIDSQGNGLVSIKSAVSDRCLQVYGPSLDNDAAIVQWDCAVVDYQSWQAKQQ